MAFDEDLAHRLRELANELMVRVGPDAYQDCLTLPHAREMDFTGRAMRSAA